MRIIGYIEHPTIKITIFKTDTRLSAKFEMGNLEQTYKFARHSGLEGIKEVRQLVNTEFLSEVEKHFELMKEIRSAALGRHLPPDPLDEFDKII